MWKQPFHQVEAIANRNLSVRDNPPVFVLSTPFPPDDRSVGHERGTSISKAWDAATTDGAIEIANYVCDRLPQLAGVRAGRETDLRSVETTRPRRAEGPS